MGGEAVHRSNYGMHHGLSGGSWGGGGGSTGTGQAPKLSLPKGYSVQGVRREVETKHWDAPPMGLPLSGDTHTCMQLPHGRDEERRLRGTRLSAGLTACAMYTTTVTRSPKAYAQRPGG